MPHFECGAFDHSATSPETRAQSPATPDRDLRMDRLRQRSQARPAQASGADSMAAGSLQARRGNAPASHAPPSPPPPSPALTSSGRGIEMIL